MDVDNNYLNIVNKTINTYCAGNSTIDYESVLGCIEEFNKMKLGYSVIGGVLSLILGIIGIVNYINTMITSIYTRQRELSVMQAVGMTGLQLVEMLIFEGILYLAGILVFVSTVGNLIDFLLVYVFGTGVSTYQFTMMPVLWSIPVILVLTILVSVICCVKLNRKSLIDRIRLMEI